MSEEKKIGGRAFGKELNVEAFIDAQVEAIREQVGLVDGLVRTQKRLDALPINWRPHRRTPTAQ